MNPMSLLLALVFTLTLAAPLSVGIDNKLRFEVVPAETAASPVERAAVDALTAEVNVLACASLPFIPQEYEVLICDRPLVDGSVSCTFGCKGDLVPSSTTLTCSAASGWSTLPYCKGVSLHICGENLSGQIGNGEASATVESPFVIPEIDGKEIITAGATREGMFAVDTSGHFLYKWGHSKLSPIYSNFFESAIVQVDCIYLSCVALAADNSVWAWGLNQYLETFSDVKDTLPPIKAPDFGPVRTVSKSTHTTYVTTWDGRVYGCGYSPHGQLGIDATTSLVREISVLGDKKINKVHGGGYSVVATTDDFNVYVLGANTYAQLCLTASSKVITYTLLTDALLANKVLSAHCTLTNCIFVTASDVYACGRGEGLGDANPTPVDKSTPTSITAHFPFAIDEDLQITVGSHYSHSFIFNNATDVYTLQGYQRNVDCKGATMPVNTFNHIFNTTTGSIKNVVAGKNHVAVLMNN